MCVPSLMPFIHDEDVVNPQSGAIVVEDFEAVVSTCKV